MSAQDFPRPPVRHKGRGALSNPEGRFEPTMHCAESDGWDAPPDETGAAPRLATTVTEERARSIISRNDSPDVPFDQSINPYRGCEHGCIYCYARPSHAYLNLSPGLDFETKLFAKTNAAEQLRKELAKPGYRCSPINLGANTDPYQPIERRLRITRSILEVLLETKHPCTIVSKNALIERDLDLLTPMAEENLVHVFISCSHLDNHLAAKLEPRASAPHRRIQAIKSLNEAGVPCGVLVAPIIPALNDRHMEHVLEAAAQGGAKVAGYTTLRLPHELKQLFREWLDAHVPQRADHVMSLVQQMNGGRVYDSDFHTRMHGQGVFAQLLSRRFDIACAKYGYTRRGGVRLDTSKFTPTRAVLPQGRLF